MLLSLGIKIRPNTSIGITITIDDLFRDGYNKAVFIGTGVWRPDTLHIKGESLGNVHFTINYLTNPDVLVTSSPCSVTSRPVVFDTILLRGPCETAIIVDAEPLKKSL